MPSLSSSQPFSLFSSSPMSYLKSPPPPPELLSGNRKIRRKEKKICTLSYVHNILPSFLPCLSSVLHVPIRYSLSTYLLPVWVLVARMSHLCPLCHVGENNRIPTWDSDELTITLQRLRNMSHYLLVPYWRATNSSTLYQTTDDLSVGEGRLFSSMVWRTS